MDFVRNGIANSLLEQWRNTLMYKDFSFCYVIIITKHLYFAIIYVCVCVCVYVLLSNSKIKPKTQSILTKHKKLFFFNHNFNHSFNQTQETVFFFNHSFNQTPTFLKINLTKSTFFIKSFFFQTTTTMPNTL
jgi:preprotein translocase subunit SecG